MRCSGASALFDQPQRRPRRLPWILIDRDTYPDRDPPGATLTTQGNQDRGSRPFKNVVKDAGGKGSVAFLKDRATREIGPRLMTDKITYVN